MKNKEMLRVSDERLQELIKSVEFCLDNWLEHFGVEITRPEGIEVVSALTDYQLLRQREDEDKHTLLDSDLLQTVDELRKQNKLLIEDGDRLAKEYKDVYKACDVIFDGGIEDVIKRHNALMDQIE